MEPENCQSNHEQIMEKLASIEKRMTDDWKLIDAANKDLIGRTYLYTVLKFVGFSGITWLIVHFST